MLSLMMKLKFKEVINKFENNLVKYIKFTI
jgi:hypothetical protein